MAIRVTQDDTALDPNSVAGNLVGRVMFDAFNVRCPPIPIAPSFASLRLALIASTVHIECRLAHHPQVPSL